MADLFPIGRVLQSVRREVEKYKTPFVTRLSENNKTPFQILVSTVLSLRTQDKHTDEASQRLFKHATTPKDLAKLSESKIAELIYPVGFYNTKARTLRQIAGIIKEAYNGETPEELDELLKLPGVGRKTANLVRTLGHRLPSICVDTHVHRITNRWGYVKTKTPDETELALREKLPGKYWIPINDWLVTFGQNICKPQSPICSRCPVEKHCGKIGVSRSR